MKTGHSIIHLDQNNLNLMKWKQFITNLLNFLEMNKELLDSYVLDFYSMNLWNNFNLKWIQVFEHFTTEDLSNLLKKDSALRCKKVYPLSLLAFRASCSAFTLPRKPISGPKDVNSFFNQSGSKELTECADFINSEVPWQNPDAELSAEGGQHYLLNHGFRNHLKPKKQHEVVRMSQISAQLFHSSKSEVIIDVGSGQGHLARLTSYGYGIPTICIDAEEKLIYGARKFDQQLEACVKRTRDNNVVGPRHGIFCLHPDLTEDDFTNMLNETWPELEKEKSSFEKGVPFSLVGLHCCGDLGPILMRLFSSVPSCRSLLLVGCCYMKLSTKSERENYEGYPMSQFLKNKKNSELSYTAKEMACHALEAYSLKLKDGVDRLKVHCYRSILEELIVQKNPELKHSGLRSVKNAHLLSFKEYAVKALNRLEKISFKDHELENEDISNKLKDWMKVVTFYSIRLMMAPAVESLILLDRLFFIHENGGAKSCLVPIFDPALSPRNHALMTSKD